MVTLGTALLMAATSPTMIAAQTSADPPIRPSALDSVPKPRVPSLVRYGKWVALGTAVALGYEADRSHQDANDTYQTLRSRCFAIPLSCDITPSGSYADPVSEQLYRDTRAQDHRAARFLIGAEVSFAAAAVGFVWELLKREDRTPNIPFEPRVETTARETRVGMSLRF